MHRTFRYPKPESTSRRKWQLRSANKYCALLFLFSKARSSWVGLLSRATVMSSESVWCEAWVFQSAGRSSTWQSTQNLLRSSGRETNSRNLAQDGEETLYTPIQQGSCSKAPRCVAVTCWNVCSSVPFFSLTGWNTEYPAQQVGFNHKKGGNVLILVLNEIFHFQDAGKFI